MTKKRLLVVSEYYPPYIKGGAEISTSIICHGLLDTYSVTVLTGKHQKEVWSYEGVTVVPGLLLPDEHKGLNFFRRTEELLTYYFRNKRFLNQMLKKWEPDIIQVVPNNYFSFSSILPAVFSLKPLVIDVRNYSLMNRSLEDYDKSIFSVCSWIYDRINFFYFKHNLCNNLSHRIKFVALSEFVRNEMIKDGYPKELIDVIYNPSPVVTWKLKPLKVKNQIVFAGRLEKDKGVMVLLQAMNLLKRSNIKLLIAGTGSHEQELKEYAEKKILLNVKFLGKISYDKVLKIYSQSTAVVAPILWDEPFGRFVQESVSLGVPLISTYSGGVPEVIKDGENGILVEKGNHANLADAISKLCNNEDLRLKLVDNLVKSRELFLVTKLINERKRLYERIVNG